MIEMEFSTTQFERGAWVLIYEELMYVINRKGRDGRISEDVLRAGAAVEE